MQTEQQTHSSPNMPATVWGSDHAQIEQWRALVKQKIKRKSALLQDHYHQQPPQQQNQGSIRGRQHEQLFHIIDLNFHHIQDWQQVIDCVLSGDETMQQSATLERWAAMLTLGLQAARHLVDLTAEAELSLRLGMLRRNQRQLHATETCLMDAERLFTQLGFSARLPTVWREQAEQRIEQGDYQTALEILQRAETQLQHVRVCVGMIDFHTATQIALYCSWGLLADVQGDTQAAIQWYEKSFTIASVGESIELPMQTGTHQAAIYKCVGSAHERLGRVYYYAGNHEAAFSHLTAARRIAEALDNDVALSRILSLTGTVWGISGQLQQSIDCFLQVCDVAERCGYWALLMTAHSNLAVSYYRLGQHTQALHAVRRAIQWAKRLEHLIMSISIYVNECEILCALAQPAAAQSALQEAERLLASVDHTPLMAAFVAGAGGRLAALNGAVTEAIQHFLAAIALSKETDNRFEAAEFSIELVPLYTVQQQWAEAESWIAFIHTVGQELQQSELVGQAAVLTGDLASRQGADAVAQAAYQRAWAAFHEQENDRNRYLAAQLAERTRLWPDR